MVSKIDFPMEYSMYMSSFWQVSFIITENFRTTMILTRLSYWVTVMQVFLKSNRTKQLQMRNHNHQLKHLVKSHTHVSSAISRSIMLQIYHDTKWQYTRKSIRSPVISATKYSPKCVIWKRIKIMCTMALDLRRATCAAKRFKIHHCWRGTCYRIQVCWC